MLKQIDNALASVSGDGTYDAEAVYEAIAARNPKRRTKVIISPPKNAQVNPVPSPAPQDRNRHIKSIDRMGRREWEKKSGYSKRSLVENSVYRYKAIVGREMRSRTLAGQRVEVRIGCKILNTMASLGMPESYKVN